MLYNRLPPSSFFSLLADRSYNALLTHLFSSSTLYEKRSWEPILKAAANILGHMNIIHSLYWLLPIYPMNTQPFTWRLSARCMECAFLPVSGLAKPRPLRGNGKHRLWSERYCPYKQAQPIRRGTIGKPSWSFQTVALEKDNVALKDEIHAVWFFANGTL